MSALLRLDCARAERSFLDSSITKPCIAVLVVFSLCEVRAEKCMAECGTLMRWNSELAGAGGPNLDEPLVTDRPDFTEAAVTVGRGVVQIESGYTYFFDNDGTDEVITHSYPESLFRVGVFADWFEVRCGFFYGTEQVNGLRDSGAEDLYLGAKIALTGQAGLLPEMAIMPQMTVPTGSDLFSADETLPGLNWLYAWDINDRSSTIRRWAGSSLTPFISCMQTICPASS